MSSNMPVLEQIRIKVLEWREELGIFLTFVIKPVDFYSKFVVSVPLNFRVIETFRGNLSLISPISWARSLFEYAFLINIGKKPK